MASPAGGTFASRNCPGHPDAHGGPSGMTHDQLLLRVWDPYKPGNMGVLRTH